MMNTAEILRAAAARVRARWDRGGLSGHCALHAVRKTLRIREPQRIYELEGPIVYVAQVVVDALALPISPMFDDAGTRVYDWNDAEGQTAENVAAGLEYAALLWEEEQSADARLTKTAKRKTRGSATKSSSSSSVDLISPSGRS
jgi:hypothetical protein